MNIEVCFGQEIQTIEFLCNTLMYSELNATGHDKLNGMLATVARRQAVSQDEEISEDDGLIMGARVVSPGVIEIQFDYYGSVFFTIED